MFYPNLPDLRGSSVQPVLGFQSLLSVFLFCSKWAEGVSCQTAAMGPATAPVYRKPAQHQHQQQGCYSPASPYENTEVDTSCLGTMQHLILLNEQIYAAHGASIHDTRTKKWIRHLMFCPSWMQVGISLLQPTSPAATAKFSVTSSFLQVGLTPTLRNAQPLPKMSNLSHLCWSWQTLNRTLEAYAAVLITSPFTLISPKCQKKHRKLYLRNQYVSSWVFPICFTVPLVAIITRPTSLSPSLPLFCWESGCGIHTHGT